MSFISYTTGVPNPNNNPSTDVNNMQTNTNSINSWTAIDHFGFNDNNGGYHKMVHLPVVPAIPAAPTGAASVVYSQTAPVSGQTQISFQNAQYSLALTLIKGWVVFSVGPSPTFTITVHDAGNITVARNSVGNYTLTVGANVLKVGSTYGVLLSGNQTGANPFVSFLQYKINSATSFDIYSSLGFPPAAWDPVQVSCIVYQW